MFWWGKAFPLGCGLQTSATPSSAGVSPATPPGATFHSFDFHIPLSDFTMTKLEQAFLDDAPYAPEAMFFDEVKEINIEASRVAVAMTVTEHLPLVSLQRAHPKKHPQHLNGGLMIHLTGMLGLFHAYYVFGLRHAEGWIGYGAKIHSARFLALAPPGQRLELVCQGTRSRKSNDSILGRYEFKFFYGDTMVYEGDQTAMWMKTPAS
jgi:3-hydroxymyristoyl/3-hydroxydecanoyl-(acyl carrier protein) dehydratase